MAHAMLSPSSASRWMVCPGSASLCRHTAPDAGKDKSFANEGTFAHEVAAALLTGNELPKSNDFSASAVADEVRPYVEYVRSLPGTLLVEQSLSIEPITGEADAYGTADAVLVGDDELFVCDLKYGMGVKVDAVNNPQIAIYAGAALASFGGLLGDFKKIHAVIIQPRLDHVSEWVLSAEELQSFLEKVTACAATARAQLDQKDDSLVLCPGKTQCQFCDAASRCCAYAEFVAKVTQLDLPKPALSLMSNEELGKALMVVEAVEQWCNRVREDAFQSLLDGNVIPGWKLVAGREGRRTWDDELGVDEVLKRMKVPVADRYTKKLISPTQAKKLIKQQVITEKQWERLEKHITRSEPKPCVVPETDKRPEWVRSSAEDFPDLTVSE